MLDEKTKAQVVRRLAKRPGYSIRERVREEIVRDFASGSEPKDIARRHKVSLTTVYKWISRAAQ